MHVLPRRTLLAGAAATAGLLVLPGRAPAQGGRKKLDGVTLHVTCFSHTYSEFLRSYLPEFEEATGAKVVYDTPPSRSTISAWTSSCRPNRRRTM
jgi:multiple sugar transport system substrate-binding protein